MPNALRCLAVCLLLLVVPAAHADVDAQTAWRLLDYIAVDYPEAVQGGQVVNAGEYAEMTEFPIGARTPGRAAGDSNSRMLLQAEQLQAAIAGKAAPETVAGLARTLAAGLLAAYPVPLAPTAAVDLTHAPAVYSTWRELPWRIRRRDGPAALALTRTDRFHGRSAGRPAQCLALYQVIEQGLEGTGMASYATLPAADRWALSFYIGQFAYPADLAAQGERLWDNDKALRQQFPDMGTLTQITPAKLASEVGEANARALTAYLRRQPQAVQAEPEGSLTLARGRLAESVEAYAAGDQRAPRPCVVRLP